MNSLRALATTCGLGLLWVLLVGGLQRQEMLLGCVCLGCSMAFVAFVWRARSEHLRFSVRSVMEIWRVPGSVIADAGCVVKILLRDVVTTHPAESLYVEFPFQVSEDEPLRAGCEVLAVTYMTASPNAVVLGVDHARERMMIHQLERTPVPALAKRLGARPVSLR